MRIIKRDPRPIGRGSAPGSHPSARTRDFPDPYYTLLCGHVTDRDTQMVYSVFKPKGNKHFCETCGRWVARTHNPSRASIPDDPMF